MIVAADRDVAVRLLPGFGPQADNVTGERNVTRCGEEFMAACAKVVDRSPPRRSDAGAAIDTEHLSRMTLGERSLEREVLALFDRQADLLLPRIRRGAPAVALALAHTLKGLRRSASARSGWRRRRRPSNGPTPPRFGMRRPGAAIDTLAAVLDEAKAEIARLLRMP